MLSLANIDCYSFGGQSAFGFFWLKQPVLDYQSEKKKEKKNRRREKERSREREKVKYC
jgi:hypothetical protein